MRSIPTLHLGVSGVACPRVSMLGAAARNTALGGWLFVEPCACLSSSHTPHPTPSLHRYAHALEPPPACATGTRTRLAEATTRSVSETCPGLPLVQATSPAIISGVGFRGIQAGLDSTAVTGSPHKREPDDQSIVYGMSDRSQARPFGPDGSPSRSSRL